MTAPSDFGSHHTEASNLTNCRPWMSPISPINPAAAPPGCIESKIWCRARLRLGSHLPLFSQFTPVDFDFDCNFLWHQSTFFISSQALRGAPYSPAQSNLESRETAPNRSCARIVSTQAPTLGHRILLSVLKPSRFNSSHIVVSRPSHLQCTRRLRLPGASSRVHFVRYTWSRI